MSKIVLRELKPVDLMFLIVGIIFALLLLASLIAPMVDANLITFCKYAAEPLGGIAFSVLGIFILRNQKQPQRNFGFFLIAAGVFAFIITAVIIGKALF